MKTFCTFAEIKVKSLPQQHYIIQSIIQGINIWHPLQAIKCKNNHKPRLTLWRPHDLAMLAAPAQWVEVCRHDVAPEVGTPVILVALVPQQQQLATRGDDVSHPVRAIGLRAHAHLQLHAWRQPRLQALVHLKHGLNASANGVQRQATCRNTPIKVFLNHV